MPAVNHLPRNWSGFPVIPMKENKSSNRGIGIPTYLREGLLVFEKPGKSAIGVRLKDAPMCAKRMINARKNLFQCSKFKDHTRAILHRVDQKLSCEAVQKKEMRAK